MQFVMLLLTHIRNRDNISPYWMWTCKKNKNNNFRLLSKMTEFIS